MSEQSEKLRKQKEINGLLLSLMASVRVTNPIARNNPKQAIEEMGKLLTKFPIGSIKTVVGEYKLDGEAVWPTAGEIIQKIKDADTGGQAAIEGRMSIAARRHPEFAKINGWRYDQIMNGTKEGRARKYVDGHTFMRSLIEGKHDLPPEMAWSPDKARNSQKAA